MRVLVVEDDPAVRGSLERALKLEGHDALFASTGLEGLDLVRDRVPDVVVLDLGLPDIDGLEVCRRLRGSGDRTPVLILTAREGVSERVAGLDAGADDYLVKPFSLDELFARIRALARRAAADSGGDILRFGDVTLDLRTYAARRGDRAFDLTRTEFMLLELFMRNPRHVLTREVIFDRVWGFDFGPTSNSLDVYIGYLRRKMEAGSEPRLIHTIRGVGYVLREDR
jgi:two-component system, OmpR family, response regulator MprA